jgi:long-chain acyl-CoA synthetase
MKQLSKKLSHNHPWSKYYPKKYPYQLKDAEMPIYHWLDQAADQYPEKAFLIFNNSELNFGLFQQLSFRFAYFLQDRGLQKGDRVILMLPNCPQFAIAFFGLLRMGIISVPLNPQFTSSELVYYLNDLEPKLIFTLNSFKDKVRRAIHLSSSKAKMVITKHTDILDYLKDKKSFSDTAGNAESFGSYDFLINQNEFKGVDIKPQKDIAVILYTGGTTGEPKGVMLSHCNICSQLISHNSHCGYGIGNKKSLLVLPPHHVFGLSMIISAALRRASLVVMEKFDPNKVIQLIQEKKIEAFFGVPAMYAALIKYYMQDQQKSKLNSLTFCLSGGSPISVPLWHKIKEMAPHTLLLEGYGLTEASGGPLLDPVAENYHKKDASVGIPIFNAEVKIIDPVSGKDLPPDQHGEIVTKSDHVFKGYWRKPELTKEIMKDEWLHTKDIGSMDEDGMFFIEGRLDDMINVRGEKVWSREVEKVLENHPKVEEVAVIGVKDDYYGQIIKACIVLKDKQKVLKEELKEFCIKRLVSYKVPKKIGFFKKLPKSHLGKVLHYKLRELSKNI